MDGERFASICRIPLELELTESSVRDAVRASGYATLRGEFPPRNLADYLRQHPDLVESWAAYSEDKRSDGWYFRRPSSVGRIRGEPPPTREMHYPDPAAACAAFIIGELNDIIDDDPDVQRLAAPNEH